MSRFTNREYLTQDQYRDASNLDARIQLHRKFSTNPYGWYDWVFDTLAQLPPHARILELGTGSGEMWKDMARRIPQGWDITLSDLSAGMLDSAWRNLVVTGRNFKFEQINAQSIPYEDESFDAVIANHMLYHVPDRSQALSEIKRVLKTGGHLTATTIGDGHMKEMNAWLARASDNRQRGMFSQLFTLENGRDQLLPFFPHVEMLRYEDDLQVTEVDAIVAYIRSAIRADDLSQSGLGSLAQELTSVLDKAGHIFISKDSGLFQAIKQENP